MLREHISKRWSRKQLVRNFLAPVQPQEQYMTLDRLDLPATTVRREQMSKGGDIGANGRPTIGPLETAVTVEFFQANTFVLSGAKTLARRMALSQAEMYALYRAHFPMMCRRAENLAEAALYGPMCSHLSTQLSIANKMSRVEGWSESTRQLAEKLTSLRPQGGQGTVQVSAPAKDPSHRRP